MWNLPRPGTKPVSPALVGGFSSTVPLGKSRTIWTSLQIFQREYSPSRTKGIIFPNLSFPSAPLFFLEAISLYLGVERSCSQWPVCLVNFISSFILELSPESLLESLLCPYTPQSSDSTTICFHSSTISLSFMTPLERGNLRQIYMEHLQNKHFRLFKNASVMKDRKSSGTGAKDTLLDYLQAIT